MSVIICGDALTELRKMPDESVHCVITSPPYWGLRDYGVAGQLGLEPTPELYVEHMVEVFREVNRVLRDDGTLWLNLGDSYAGKGIRTNNNASGKSTLNSKPTNLVREKRIALRLEHGLKPKDMVGIPWRVAFALQADTVCCHCNGTGRDAPHTDRWCDYCAGTGAESGWWLRSDIIWHKPNPMPESVTDRPTKSHEYLFLLSKSKTYYYDADAIREPAITSWHGIGGYREGNIDNSFRPVEYRNDKRKRPGRNKRTVWTIATRPFPEAHFATFPPMLVEPCILAGTSERGCCPECGAPWERVVEKVATGQTQKMADGWDTGEGGHGTIHRQGREQGEVGKPIMAPHTIGWRPTCDCDAGESVPCVVLDPFFGAGTVGLVALQHRREFIGIELNPDYCAMAEKRLAIVQPALML